MTQHNPDEPDHDSPSGEPKINESALRVLAVRRRRRAEGIEPKRRESYQRKPKAPEVNLSDDDSPRGNDSALRVLENFRARRAAGRKPQFRKSYQPTPKQAKFKVIDGALNRSASPVGREESDSEGHK